MSTVVFILGAGASAQGGCPVMSNFIEVAHRLSSDGDDEAFTAHFWNVRRVQQLLQRSAAKSVIDINNIESVFSAVEMAIAIGSLGDAGLEWLLSARRSLLTVIARTLEKTQSYLIRPHIDPSVGVLNSGPDGYRELATLSKSLIDRKHRVGFITFNYDCGLETALQSSGVSYSYCLEGESADNAVVPVCKLHGSLSWSATGTGRETRIQFVEPTRFLAKFRNSSEPIRSYLPLSSELRVIAPDSDGLPFIVPPTDGKAEARKLMAPVWRTAGQILREAESVVICGYSLPESDLFFRTFFALCMSSDTILRRLWVFDTAITPYERLAKLVGPAISQAGGFSNFPIPFGQMGTKIQQDFEAMRWVL